MSNKTFYVLVAVSMLAVPGFSEKERVIRVQNHLRVGYDDNVYQTKNKDGSAFITDIVNLTGKATFSSRTDALLYWQPEFRYRFDADPEMISYQDLYARLNHAVSQRAFLTVSDRFRYQMKDGQSGAGIKTTDQNYYENDLMGAIDYTISSLSQVKIGGGYEFRVWDDETYGETLSNNYDQYRADASYLRQLIENRTVGVLGVNYVKHEYDGSRGGYDSATVMAGADQNFNPNLTGFGRVGYSFTTVDGVNDEDTSSPYLDAGLDYSPSARTTINGSMGYSMYRSENSIYNAQDRFNLALGVRHDITAKINLASSIAYIFSYYDATYSRGPTVPDAEDGFFRFNIRGTYQINRNNFLEAGYEFSDRSSDSAFLAEYDRNLIDIGWRLRL